MNTEISCPLCGTANTHTHLIATDFTVSHKRFTVTACDHCSGKFTADAPSADAIGPYYAAASYISHSDTTQGLVNRLYHAVRKKTLREKKSLIEKLTGKSDGKFLDIGAGTGAMVHTMRHAGWDVTGLEPDPTARENAKRITGETLLPAEQLFEQAPGSFDAVTMWHVLEHVHDLHGYLQQIRIILRDQGVFVVAVPNHTSYDAKYYGKYWAAWDVPRHLYHFSPGSVKKLMEKEGFEVVKMLPMRFDAFYVSMLSEQYKTGSSNHLRALWIGIKSNLEALGKPHLSSSVIYIIKKRS